ncbi:MAG: hypothetical protein QNJ09_18820 [Paracoccaceae bacterium]|nr:hypothetical protein [Paracoccaceae bacterium]
MRRLFGVLVACFAAWPQLGWAEAGSLARGSLLLAGRVALISPDPQGASAAARGSLFQQGQRAHMLTPMPAQVVAARVAPKLAAPVATGGSRIHRLRAIIGEAESRRDGYDAVQFGARIKPSKPPTQMTLAEIFEWIDDTPGQPHAIGRYQFIPATLRRLVKRQKLPQSAVFSPAMQDQLADQLLAEAGLQRFQRGDIGRHSFMNNLAKIWAGLPNSSGKSHYHGYAGNKATMSWTRFDAEMRAIFAGET